MAVVFVESGSGPVLADVISAESDVRCVWLVTSSPILTHCSEASARQTGPCGVRLAVMVIYCVYRAVFVEQDGSL